MRRLAMERWKQRPFGVAAALGVLAGQLLLAATPVRALTPCTPGPSCPTAVEDEYTTDVAHSLAVRAPGLLANDRGIPGTQVDVENSDTDSYNGAAVRVRTDGSFVYRPSTSDPVSGIDYFDYYIQDSQGGWTSGTVTVQVNAIVRNDGYQAAVDTPLTIAAPGVFANDVAYDKTSLIYDTPTRHNGDLTLNQNGSFEYVPPRGFSGTDSFTYTVYDTLGDNSFTGTVKIAVGAQLTPGTTSPAERDPAGNKPVPPNPSDTASPRRSSGSDPSSPSTRAATVGPTPNTRSKGASSTATSSTTRATKGTTGSIRGNGAGTSTSHPSDGDDSSAPVLPIALSIAAVLVAAGGGYAWWRRRAVTRAGTPPAAPTP